MRLIIRKILFFCATPMVHAQDLGIQFDKMPVGTKMHYVNYKGDSWVSTFKGRKGRYYLVTMKYTDRTYNTKRYYSLDGHLEKFGFRAAIP